MANNYFKFKQFTIYQDRCSMKVGTDGVLIGAWGAVGDNPVDLLDIGCGTGVISLMAAQRNPSASIEAIDIDEEAAMQATENVTASPWGGRITVYARSLAEHRLTSDRKYDYILSNPPYFIDSLKSPDSGRTVARHTDSLPYEELADGVAALLKPEGIFSVIFPYVQANVFIALAADRGLYLHEKLEVRGNPNRPVNRLLLRFGFERVREVITDRITIEEQQPGLFSRKYREMMAPYYLNF